MTSRIVACVLLTLSPHTLPRQTGAETLLRVTVTATQPGHKSMLVASDFRVFEDDVEQIISSAIPVGDQPVAFTLLIDASNSMEQEFEQTRELAFEFVRRLKSQDVAEIVSFGQRVRRDVAYTNDVTQLERAIAKLSRSGATSLHNALYVTLKELAKLTDGPDGRARRYVVLVFSDGEDTSSLVPFAEVLAQSRRTDAIVYGFGPKRPVSREQIALRQLVEDSGGRWILPLSITDVEPIMSAILSELSGQYVIRYTSRNSRVDGKWRRIDVRTTAAGVHVRSRSGYFAPRR